MLDDRLEGDAFHNAAYGEFERRTGLVPREVTDGGNRPCCYEVAMHEGVSGSCQPVIQDGCLIGVLAHHLRAEIGVADALQYASGLCSVTRVGDSLCKRVAMIVSRSERPVAR